MNTTRISRLARDYRALKQEMLLINREHANACIARERIALYYVNKRSDEVSHAMTDLELRMQEEVSR